ncbi:DsbC family protein [Photorhabdus heterorhabditis]|uniref:DsbC family protein n=1 Tax=Photorhabdus heterorhabditis TaxID=880156 RepID=UPI0006C83FB9|nr:DsbC family protein [Photorhabdus heterorhabditis]
MSHSYSASLQGKTLSVISDQPYKNTPVIVMELGKNYRFYINDRSVYHDSTDQHSAMIYAAQNNDEARMIVSTINREIIRSKEKLKNRKKVAGYSILVAAIILIATSAWRMGITEGSNLAQNIQPSLNTTEKHHPINPPNRLSSLPHPGTTVPVSSAMTNVPIEQPKPTIKTEDYQYTAQRLRTAAQSGRYTIPLSSGHARTLYVFSDPMCPNCKIIEPALEELSRNYNVEIFPVTIIGGQQTANLVTPVLCTPSQERKPFWKQLYQADVSMVPNNQQASLASASCEIGEQALEKNDAAFNFYNLPGTPSLLADDGRYIPLESLKSDDALSAFLNSPIQ